MKEANKIKTDDQNMEQKKKASELAVKKMIYPHLLYTCKEIFQGLSKLSFTVAGH